MKKLIYLFVIAILVSGCATVPRPGTVWMYTKPLVKCEKDPMVDFKSYNSFSIFPQAELDKESKMSPIIEKQLLFMLMNTFELIGYDYVDKPELADFIVGVTYSNEYKSEYIPPSSYTVPWYVPGQTQTTFINNYNTFSGSIGSRPFYGSGSGWGTATTTTPGYYVPMTFTRPGGYVGWYYPCIFVSIFDRNSKKLIWNGSVVGTTPQADIRLSGQVLLGYLFVGKEEFNFPVNMNNLKKKSEKKDGSNGITVISQTLDGNNFYPIIIRIVVNSPAYKQGLKPLDILTQVNKESTLNWSMADIDAKIRKNKGETLGLTVKRGDKVWDVILTAEDIETAKKEWKEAIALDEHNNEKRVKIPQSP